MKFWIREFAGWMLLVLSLFVFYRCYLLLTTSHAYVEGGALTLIGIVIFRGGIHLLKIAVAARICIDAEEQLKDRPSDRMPGTSRRSAIQTIGARRDS